MFFGIDLEILIRTIGYLGIFGFIFAESGLLIGFFLPGDTLLFTAGFLASQNYLNIAILALGSWVFAVLGDNFGYAFGKRVGPRLFKREDSFWFHKDHLARAQKFYELHGGKAIVFARFTPIVRTFAPIVAGMGNMRYRTFLMYNIIGGGLWGVGLPLLGYFLGSVISDIDKYLLPIILGIFVISILPVAIPWIRQKIK